MLPGRYLRLRRQAAGLTIEQAAVRIAPRPSRWHDTAKAIEALEAGDPGLDGSPSHILAHQLLTAFPFNLLVWEILEEHRLDPDSELPVPRICTACGCTWTDPCRIDRGLNCAWRSVAQDLCTACPAPTPVEVAS